MRRSYGVFRVPFIVQMCQNATQGRQTTACSSLWSKLDLVDFSMCKVRFYKYGPQKMQMAQVRTCWLTGTLCTVADVKCSLQRGTSQLFVAISPAVGVMSKCNPHQHDRQLTQHILHSMQMWRLSFCHT